MQESKLPLGTKTKQDKKKQDTIESDSEPSCDNFDQEELKDIFEEVLTAEDKE